MRQVTFCKGPFLDQYEDGHPPEKGCEEERRRYRSGLPSKADFENGAISGSHFEQAFQEWLGRYKERYSTPSLVDTDKEGAFLVGPLQTAEEGMEGESIPAADYTYKSIGGDGIGKKSKECFVIDITAIPSYSARNDTEDKSPQTRQSLLGCWRTQSRSEGEPTRCAIARPFKCLPLYPLTNQ